jgi:DNA-binding NarL/FixJ family response regulator
MKNILIIDDHEIVAEGIKKRVKKVFSDANCIFVDNVRAAYAEMNHQKIDLVICDLEFDKDPQHNGFYIVSKILELEPEAKFIALTHYNSYRIMKKAIASGFMSYLNKGCSFNEFSDTIKNVLKNGRYQSPTEVALLKKRMDISRSIFNDSLQGVSLLSKRELEVTLLSIKTTDRNELSKLLHIEANTVDSHLKRIMYKLSLNSRKEVAMFAMDFKTELEQECNRR